MHCLTILTVVLVATAKGASSQLAGQAGFGGIGGMYGNNGLAYGQGGYGYGLGRGLGGGIGNIGFNGIGQGGFGGGLGYANARLGYAGMGYAGGMAGYAGLQGPLGAQVGPQAGYLGAQGGLLPQGYLGAAGRQLGPVQAAVVPVAAVAPAPTFAYSTPDASQYHSQDEGGNYAYGYQNVNSAKMEQGNSLGGVQGSYSYVDSNGLPQTVSYVADALGFRARGTNFPSTAATEGFGRRRK